MKANAPSEVFDAAGLLLCIGAGTLDGLAGAPWWAYLFPVFGAALFGLRLFVRAW